MVCTLYSVWCFAESVFYNMEAAINAVADSALQCVCRSHEAEVEEAIDSVIYDVSGTFSFVACGMSVCDRVLNVCLVSLCGCSCLKCACVRRPVAFCRRAR